MACYFQSSSVNPQNSTPNLLQQNKLELEKISDPIFLEKNIHIEDTNKIQNQLNFTQKQIPNEIHAINQENKSIQTCQPKNKSDISQFALKQKQVDKQFNDLSYDQSQKQQNIAFNKIFMKFIGSGIINQLTVEIKNIIKVQKKLDELLIYMKTVRNKLLGLSFKQIKRKLWSSSQANLTVQIFKQIIFLAPQFYATKYSHLIDDNFPYLIRLPQKQIVSEQRSFQFKKLIFSYIIKMKIKQNHHQGPIKIPLISNDYFQLKKDQKSFVINQQLNEKRAEIFVRKKQSPKDFSPFNILDNSSNFKQTLYLLIKQKEIKMKQIQKEKQKEKQKQKQKGSSSQQKMSKKRKPFDRKIDELINQLEEKTMG